MILTWELHIVGMVQGVGFRPFINRIALKNPLRAFIIASLAVFVPRDSGNMVITRALEGGRFSADFSEAKAPASDH